jgi:hypothetical protein
MKLSVFCGASVDGFLACLDDTFDFLQTGEQEPHGFAEFLASVDVVVIAYGQKTCSARCPTHEPHVKRRLMINQAR